MGRFYPCVTATILGLESSAVAERLWTNPRFTDWDEAGPRMEQQRCRMIK